MATKLVVTRTDKDFNRPLLREQLEAVVPTITAGDLHGFDRISDRRWTPRTENTVVYWRKKPPPEIKIEAVPGEMWFEKPTDWTAGEETLVDGVLDAHDYTQTTAEQDRRDADIGDWQLLKDNFAAYKNETLNATQKHQFEWRAFRMLLRALQNADID